MKRIRYHYCTPKLGARACLAVLDKEGKFVKFKKNSWLTDQSWYKRYTTKTRGKCLEVKDATGSTCRETMCNDWAYFFRNVNLPEGYQLTTSLPEGEDRRSELTFGLKPQRYINKFPGWKYEVTKYSQQMSKIIKSKKLQKELSLLMDVMLGSVAIFLGGPDAFVPTKETVNVSGNRAYVGMSLKKEQIYVNTGVLKYTGLSNFWTLHPAILSIMSGLGRIAINLYCNGHYSEINEKVKLASAKKFLEEVSKKKELTKAEKGKVSLIMRKFKSFFSGKKVEERLGYFPLNKYNWTMLTQKLAKLKLEKENFKKNWQGTGPYGVTHSGFHSWCLKQKPTKMFTKRPKEGWR